MTTSLQVGRLLKTTKNSGKSGLNMIKLTNKILIISWIFFTLLFTSLCGCNGNPRKDSASSKEQRLAQEANAYYKSKKYLQAKLRYDQLLELNPNNAEYYFRRGYARSLVPDTLRLDNLNPDQGWEDAISDYLNSIRYGYKNKQSVYHNIAVLYKLEEKYDTAIFYYNKALSIDSTFMPSKVQRAEVMELMNNKK
jgi:tetratricopeptide (TPR) repeat protein